MRITALTPQKNNPNRYNLFIDDKFTLGIDSELILEQELNIGKDISQAQLELLKSKVEFQKIFDNTLRFLSYRPRSRVEVQRYLIQKKIAPPVIDTILTRLEKLEYLNDREFANFWVENREKFSPRSSHALRLELQQRGIEHEIIQEYVDQEDDLPRAIAAGQKKFRALSHLDYATFRTKMGQFLLRRGFSYSISNEAVKALWNELHSE